MRYSYSTKNSRTPSASQKAVRWGASSGAATMPGVTSTMRTSETCGPDGSGSHARTTDPGPTSTPSPARMR